MVKGEAKGSRYYPRGVTAILWLELEQDTTVRASSRAEALEEMARYAEAEAENAA